MRIGVVGPVDVVQKVSKVFSELHGVLPVPIIYQDLEEACKLVSLRQKEVNGLYFCGPIPYLMATQNIQREIPWTYLSYESTGLLLAFLHALSSMPQTIEKGCRFSVDTIASVEVKEILKETGLNIRALYTYEYSPGIDPKKDFSQFHKELYQKGKTDFSISCVRVVTKSLSEAGIPCFPVFPAAQTIRGTLQRLLLEIQNSQKDYMRTVVGLVQPEFHPNGGKFQENKLVSLYHALLAYGEKRQILVVPGGNSRRFQLVETFGQLLVETTDLTRNPLRKALLEATGLRVHIGYGVGPSLGTATIYAEKALELNLSSRSDECFVCDGFDARPLGEGLSGMPISLVAEQDSLLKYSETLRMTPAAVTRYTRAMETMGGPFSASDLSRQLGISAKGTRKILSVFLKADILIESGRRAYPGKGRPERLFELSAKGGERVCSTS